MAYEALNFAGEVLCGTWLLVTGEDAQHRAGYQSLGADEVAPGLVWVVKPAGVGSYVHRALDEERQVEVRPLSEEVLPTLEGLDDLGDASRFVGCRHVSGDVRADETDVVGAWENRGRDHVSGRADDRRVLRPCAVQLDEGLDGGLGVKWWPSVVSVQDGGLGDDVVGALGDLGQRAAVLSIGPGDFIGGDGPLGADGVQRLVVHQRNFGVQHGSRFGVSELRVDEVRVGGVPAGDFDDCSCGREESVVHDGFKGVDDFGHGLVSLGSWDERQTKSRPKGGSQGGVQSWMIQRWMRKAAVCDWMTVPRLSPSCFGSDGIIGN